MAETTTPEWHSDFPCLIDNPKASEAVAKYKDANAAMKAFAVDAQKKLGQPYILPEDHSKLTEEQKEEIRANVALMEGVPQAADGYKFTGAKGADEQAIADFKVFCKDNRISESLGKKILDFQNGFFERMKAADLKAVKDNNDEIKKQFNSDCGGEANALLRRQWIKEYLQTKCTDENGKPDSAMWEKFEKQFDEKGIDLVLLRALSEPAQNARGTGGAPAGTSPAAVAKGALDYPEMDKK